MTYRYPVAYRVQALFGSLLVGLVLIGSVIAEVEAIQNSRIDAVLHVIGFVVGAAILLLGLDFGTRSITTTDRGLQVRWVRQSFVPWSDVIGWRYLPLSLIHIRFKHGPGLYVWPILESYSELLNEVEQHQSNDKMTD